MAIALPDIATDTYLAAQSRERLNLAGKGTHTFSRPALEVFEHTANTDRKIAAPQGAHELIMKIYYPACEDCFDGQKPAILTDQHRDGLHTWASWLHNSDHAWNELKQVKRELRYEHIAIMARRDIFAQRVHQVFSYLDMAAGFSGEDPEDYTILTDMISAQEIQGWGFADHDEAADFARGFKDLVGGIPYRYVYSNELKAGTGKTAEPEMQAKLSLFSFYYFNRLFPAGVKDEAGRDARSVALDRLGLPRDTQSIDLSENQNLDLMDTFAIGRTFSHWNASYLRTDELRTQFYKPGALAA